MIYLIVAALLHLIRLISWIPGTDTQLFVYGLQLTVSLIVVGFLDRKTHIFRNIFDRLLFFDLVLLISAFCFFSTKSIWLNILGVAILLLLYFRVGGFSQNGERPTFTRFLRKIVDKLEEEPIGAPQPARPESAWSKPETSLKTNEEASSSKPRSKWGLE